MIQAEIRSIYPEMGVFIIVILAFGVLTFQKLGPGALPTFEI